MLCFLSTKSIANQSLSLSLSFRAIAMPTAAVAIVAPTTPATAPRFSSDQPQIPIPLQNFFLFSFFSSCLSTGSMYSVAMPC